MENFDEEFVRVSQASIPSQLIDAAICDLISTIVQFSDESFDADWLNLTDYEVEFLVVRLLQELTRELQGQTLKSLLEKLRHDAVN